MNAEPVAAASARSVKTTPSDGNAGVRDVPEEVDACVESVLEDNPSYSESRAYAICKAQQEAGVTEPPEVVELAETNIPAEGMDRLAEERPGEWGRFESEHGVAWVGLSTGATVYQGAEGESEQEQADGFAVDVLEVRQDGDDGPGSDGDLLGMGVDFPEADVYVDWNIEAWPDDEQLSDAHVSIYSTVEDLRNATGNTVDVVDTIGAVEAQALFDDMGLPTLAQQQERPGGYAYPDAAPEDAPPEVREAVERWRNEEIDDPDDTAYETPLLYWLLGTGTDPYKMAKADADYQGEPNGEEQCANCEFFYTGADGESICAQVAGGVEPEAWCRLYDAADQTATDGAGVVSRNAVLVDGLSTEAREGIERRYNVQTLDFMQEVPDDAVSISDPSEAPEDARTVTGPRGGLYYVPGDGGDDGTETGGATTTDELIENFDSESAPDGLDITAAENISSLEEMGFSGGHDAEAMRIAEMPDGSRVFARLGGESETDTERTAAVGEVYNELLDTAAPVHYDAETGTVLTEEIDGQMGYEIMDGSVNRDSFYAAVGASLLAGNWDIKGDNLIVDEDEDVHIFDYDFGGELMAGEEGAENRERLLNEVEGTAVNMGIETYGTDASDDVLEAAREAADDFDDEVLSGLPDDVADTVRQNIEAVQSGDFEW